MFLCRRVSSGPGPGVMAPVVNPAMESARNAAISVVCVSLVASAEMEVALGVPIAPGALVKPGECADTRRLSAPARRGVG